MSAGIDWKRPLIALILSLGRPAMALEDEFSLKQLPREGSALSDFLPRGWTVEAEARGDLDGDGIADKAAILVQGLPGADDAGAGAERERGLLVLTRHRRGKWMLGGANEDLLLCAGCGGRKENVRIDIRKGILLVRQRSGSREFTEETWRFRLDARARRFVLIGRDIDEGDATLATGTVESVNYRTGVRMTKTYRYDENTGREITVSTHQDAVARKAEWLENTDPDD